ncbi:hypothetical protein D3C72_598190 [compost metagenome]
MLNQAFSEGLLGGQFPIERLHLPLGLFLLGQIPQDPDQLRGRPSMVAQHVGVDLERKDAAVLSPHVGLEHEHFSPIRVGEHLAACLEVSFVAWVQKLTGLAENFILRVPKHSRESRVRVEDAPLEACGDDGVAAGFEQAAVPLLAFSQHLFGPLPLGDLGGGHENAHDGATLAAHGLISEIPQGRTRLTVDQVGERKVGVRVRFSRFDDLSQQSSDLRVLFEAKDLEYTPSDDLSGRHCPQLRLRRVHPLIDEVVVHIRDAGWRALDNALQHVFALVDFALELDALRHLETKNEPAIEVARLILDGVDGKVPEGLSNGIAVPNRYGGCGPAQGLPGCPNAFIDGTDGLFRFGQQRPSITPDDLVEWLAEKAGISGVC